MDVDNHSAAEDRSRRATSVLSMDDIEAAQALEGLRSDYGHSSPRTATQQKPSNASSLPASDSKPQPEPLLSLLTSTHPLISSAINGSMSAYTSSKSYSPRFKSGVEFIERNIGSPVANTVGTVGRKTGVESGLRWALQRRESSSTDPATKRRKVSGEKPPADVDVEKGLVDESSESPRVRSSSDPSHSEPLPPYDDMRSPNYEEIGRPSSRQGPSTWQSRLMISTSGLGVAMSDESLRSLQYCLTWLRWANGRLGKAIVALQSALKDWEAAQKENGEGADASLLSQRIQAVKEDVLSTLKQVVDVVSKYAGGALPENARNLVRRHLTSLPHRFQVASTSQPPPGSAVSSSDATLGAHRILVLAQEGLDMMAQVSGVVNDTLVSAEHWCERLGKKRPEGKNAGEMPPPEPRQEQQYPADVKQPICEPPRDAAMMGTQEKV
ncbi:putative clock controled protein (Ccg-8) [Aspergillus clavatus NRRL 1]|uniref:Clock controled protein (Ccg-8), putative n=1 Tax=Aspergillus clavatus (strain ATCC 1007 / CBS 513.65 / DSM 816 / NCTC 3887 / NRRL 1 / QM 1276 / 107) TaxID=344612 RepID=A1CAB9_ASPCL|nr:clock controled protein (Ccg-8), putative [Aspergillus clavatus NRRL 1]EAW12687.1 clock controled protein (Ccg-8), putative [Aspergillus clavatus NRRL 1]